MYTKEKEVIRIAVLDLYNGEANEGIRCIHELIQQFSEEAEADIITDTYAVRLSEDIPDLSYDIYISSGGPGSPLDTKGMAWDTKYFELIDSIEAWNKLPQTVKKHVFFICHSFQMICRHYGFVEISLRQPSSYGIFPVHLTIQGRAESIFETLPDPIYTADFRTYQVIRPDTRQMSVKGYEILAEESQAAPGSSDRALMAIRFSDYFFGTQFHPEADPEGMLVHFYGAKKEPIINNVGEQAYQEMLLHLKDPDKIAKTRSTVLPNFLRLAASQLVLIQ